MKIPCQRLGEFNYICNYSIILMILNGAACREHQGQLLRVVDLMERQTAA
jgi:hypothetical protein